MFDARRTEKYLPLFMAILFFSLAGIFGGTFYSRPPVLIVTDATFTRIYGAKRVERNRNRLSAALFRRVIPVPVDENAGSDLVAIAARDAFDSPHAVLFPYRYLSGANLFKEENPEVPVVVVGGERRERTGYDALAFAAADTALDLRRAVLSAALLAGGKKVLVFDSGRFLSEHREALEETLAARGAGDGTNDGVIDAPVFLSVYADYAAYDEVGCVILTGPANRFLEHNLDIPVILFSWIDPELTSRSVKIIFDDSEWALAAGAVRALARDGTEEQIFVPSTARVMRGRMDGKGDFRKIRRIFKEKFQ